MTASITVNGENLDQLLAQGVNGIAGLMKVAGPRGGNLTIPGAHGERRAPGKRAQANDLALPMWVRGVGPDGRLPYGTSEGARLAFHHRLRRLVALFPLDELVTIRHTLTDGDAREIVAEVSDVLEPDIVGAGRDTLGQVTIGLTASDPFWRDTYDTTVTITAAAGVPTTLPQLNAASAPMEDWVIEFGPSTNPRITQPSTGVYVGWNGVVPSGRTLRIDTAAWTVTGTGGLTITPADFDKLVYGGPGTSRWWALRPQVGGPVVTLGHTNGQAATCILTGRRKHRIG